MSPELGSLYSMPMPITPHKVAKYYLEAKLEMTFCEDRQQFPLWLDTCLVPTLLGQSKNLGGDLHVVPTKITQIQMFVTVSGQMGNDCKAQKLGHVVYLSPQPCRVNEYFITSQGYEMKLPLPYKILLPSLLQHYLYYHPRFPHHHFLHFLCFCINAIDIINLIFFTFN